MPPATEPDAVAEEAWRALFRMRWTAPAAQTRRSLGERFSTSADQELLDLAEDAVRETRRTTSW